MTPLDVLTSTRELLSDYTRWTQGQFARNKRGDGVHITSKDAVCWCLLGALYHSCPTNKEVRNEAYEFIASAIKDKPAGPDDMPVASFNDHASYNSVIQVLDKAISEASK